MRRMPTRDELAARLEDVRWMADTGECLDGAARRLGLSRDALERWLDRNDRAVLKVLVGRQPRDHNRLLGDVSIADLTGLGARKRREPSYGRRRQQSREAAA